MTSLTLTEFKHTFWKRYEHARHQAAIDAKLSEVAQFVHSQGREGIGRLAIFMPPRHGKTETVSRYFPAWLLGQNPDIRLILASYGATLAHRNSRFVRNLISSTLYQENFPGIQIADDSAAVDIWDIANYKGGVTAVGVGGGVTGHGANLIIIDDVVKSRAEAESETYRKKTVNWYTDDLLTRLEEPGGAIVLMMTRWHMADLAGYVLENEEGWETLSLPALAKEGDELGRQPGEALWPDRYNVDVLEDRKERMGAYSFAALYQQQPMPSGGGLFDTSHIEIIDQMPPCKQVVRFYDLAVTAKKHSDYTVGLKLGVTADEDFIVADVYRVQKTMPDVQNGIVQNAGIDGPETRIRLEAEKAGIIQLDYLLRDDRMRPYTIDKKAPEGDKYTRATPVASRVNAGKVKIVKAHWNHAFLDELSVFPMGENDDQVDAFSGAYDMTINTGLSLPVFPNW